MKSLTFKRGSDGRYYSYSFNDIYQDKPTYLSDLAKHGIIFSMLLCTKRFTCVVGKTKVTGYTDKHGNKILHIYD